MVDVDLGTLTNLVHRDGSSVMLRILNGRKGFLVDVAHTSPAGLVSKRFGKLTVHPVQREVVYDALLAELETCLRQGYEVRSSNVPLKFPAISVYGCNTYGSHVLCRDESEAQTFVQSPDYIAQVLYSRGRMIVGLNVTNKQLVFGLDTQGKPIPMPARLINALVRWHQTSPETRIVLDGFALTNGRYMVTDILYLGAPVTDMPFYERHALLKTLEDKIPIDVVVAPTAFKEPGKTNLVEMCKKSGLCIAFKHSRSAYMANGPTTMENYFMSFSEETTLQVMGVNRAAGTITLGALIDGIPVTLGSAEMPQSFELESMDVVNVRFGSVEPGFLLNIEVVAKLELDSPVDLEVKLANRLGFNLRPHPVTLQKDTGADYLGCGFLDALSGSTNK